MTNETAILIEGLGFPEGPRWHGNRLWFSDFEAKKVMTIDLDGNLETVVEVENQPSGLGWLPDQSLLIVSMIDRRLLRFNDNGLTEFADLSRLATSYCNDMVVDQHGRAFVGNMGFVIFEEPFQMGNIVLAAPTGEARIVAEEMAFPNGSVVTPDGKTLIMAETFAARLTAFNIEQDGSLTNRRVWAQFDDLGIVTDRPTRMKRVIPDGICLDAEGCIWVASPNAASEVLRVREGGEITHRIKPQKRPYACMLGGTDGKTLFIMTSLIGGEDRVGQIEMLEVDVPRAGLP
ncbi:MAG: SMP-30/gluconolactonase/LRE family protein [Deltaproteobacteria bacterium]|nr:SMP-30/gluconolactonase/LRE family protein [Deltaproteobacteria bacterium]